MIITIASGKGGTGKTTVATSLALAITSKRVKFLDCDVEAPNAHLFLRPELDQRREVHLLIPQVDETECNGCEFCAEVCQYHAIVVFAGKPLVFPQLCHGCGSCTLNCPQNAIREVPRVLGIVESGSARGDMCFAQGILNIGEPMAVPVIRQLNRMASRQEADIIIRDAPPGTSCPVVETVRGADYVLLVTEPTPFGLHDLKLAVQLVSELGLPAGVVINRDGIGNTEVDDFCLEAGLPVLMRIPMDRRIAEALARGQSLVVSFPEYLPHFRDLYVQIITQAGELKGSVL